MTGSPAGRVAQLYRHPIKALGREAVMVAALSPDAPFPHDRLWAVRHSGGQAPQGTWVKCSNFNRAAKSPSLMAISARYDADQRRVSLAHPQRPVITVAPDDPADQTALLAWLAPLIAPDLPHPTEVIASPAQGMTDTPYPSVSVLSLASLAALSQAAGGDLSPHRFRANIWLDGLDPWAEADLVGREITLGTARLLVTEPITRCRAITTDPATGQIDTDLLRLLDTLRGAPVFGLYVRVIAPGHLAVGDRLS